MYNVLGRVTNLYVTLKMYIGTIE